MGKTEILIVANLQMCSVDEHMLSALVVQQLVLFEDVFLNLDNREFKVQSAKATTEHHENKPTSVFLDLHE